MDDMRFQEIVSEEIAVASQNRQTVLFVFGQIEADSGDVQKHSGVLSGNFSEEPLSFVASEHAIFERAIHSYLMQRHKRETREIVPFGIYESVPVAVNGVLFAVLGCPFRAWRHCRSVLVQMLL